MRATGSRLSRRAASASIASACSTVSARSAIRDQLGAIDAECMGHQQAGIGLGGIDAGLAKFIGQRVPGRRDGSRGREHHVAPSAASSSA